MKLIFTSVCISSSGQIRTSKLKLIDEELEVTMDKETADLHQQFLPLFTHGWHALKYEAKRKLA